MPEEANNTTNKKDGKTAVQVKKRTVAGFIIYRKTSEGVKFLLLYRRGNYWNFPKGHFEEGENGLKAALRETEEETGIKEAELRLIPNFRTYLHYNFRVGNERIYDKVILYLAETKKPQVTIAPREHSGYAWFLYPDAVKVLGNKYVGTKKILKQANDFLRRKNGERRPPEGQRRHPRRNDRHRKPAAG